MAVSNETNDLQRANFRLCRLTTWSNYQGLGFNLENAQTPPHLIRTVESNSPASAGGLKILDVVLAVNNQDVSNADYKTVTQAIKNARDSTNRLDLLVIEKRFYDLFKRKGYTFHPALARTVQTPTVMPREYLDLPKYTPRTCEMRLKKDDPSFGFEAVNGIGDIGASVQEVIPNTPASRTTLRKSDRILEVDDKFVDNIKSDTIFERIGKAKKKRALKLYVVDTNTYKHFQENRIPLPSKDFQKSRFAKQRQIQPISPYINVEEPPEGYEPSEVGTPQPATPITIVTGNIPSTISETSEKQNSYQDDIRLCRITRNGPTDTYGIELIYHKRDQYHSLKLRSDLGNAFSNAALAGVKNNDHLIEINGENVENLGEGEVKQRIYVIKYPQPLDVLVADHATYNYYKQQNILIHSGLPSVRKLPENFGHTSMSTVSSRQEPIIGSAAPLIVPAEKPISSEPLRASLENSDNTRRLYQLQRIPGFRGYGFTVNSNQVGPPAHKIAEIYPNSPAQQQGLRVGDNIITVNNENVQQMNAADFKKFLQAAAYAAESTGRPLLLEVINDDSIQSFPPRIPVDPTYVNEMPNGDNTQKSSPYKPPEQPPSRPASQKSIPTQPVISQNEVPKLLPTKPTISRESSIRSSLAQQQTTPYQNGTHRLPSIQLKTNIPYTNGYGPAPYTQYSRPETINRSPENLTRGTIDLVSRNRLLRYCQLLAGPNQAFGFQLGADSHNNHIIRSIQPESPATRSGLEVNDLLLEVNDENIEGKSSGEVAKLIRDAAINRRLRLLVAPNSVKVLSKRSTRSLTALNDENHYRTSTVRSKYTDQDPLSSVSTGRNRSIPRSYTERKYRDRLNIPNENQSEPIEPLPRKCVLQYDPSFRGCGFRLTERENYDTPIIIEVSPNSPAKRSGLTEGDHIIYVDSQNVQNFRAFDDIIHLIQQTFEKHGQVTLVTLTGPAYQVLQKRGGYLDDATFDYQSPNIDRLKPRLCQLKLYNHEYDFGFTLQPNGYLSVKNVEEYSSADTAGLRNDDVVIEINGRAAKYLNINQIKQIIEASKEERKLDLLVIDLDGYHYSIRHAIPFNSLLSIVQKGEDKRITTSNHRHSHEPVYL